MKFYSKRLYEELQTFVWRGNRAQAQKGYHDDLIMALAIANGLFDAGSKDTYNNDDAVAKAMLFGMSRATNTFGQSNNASTPPIMTGTNIKDMAQKNRNSHQGQPGSHNYNDDYWRQYDWLIKK